MTLGLFVTGCAPGGGASNFWTILLDGNANLSVTMTFLSTLLSIGEKLRINIKNSRNTKKYKNPLN